jgi:concanavalin A-like lectin/glucanase superfamily protein/Big-like domain-containing protein/K319-like protein
MRWLISLFLLLAAFAPRAQGQASFAGTALQFNGSSQYVTFGAAQPGLGASTFTLECWFKRMGAGVATSTGSGGVTAVPLVTKGRAEAEGSNVDMNYFLGIDGTTGKLVADFEEGPSTGGTLGLNHPVSGNTVVTSSVWHHAAATYDGQTWKLYLDGVLDGTLTLAVPRPPRSDSIQHAGLATALNSTGVAAGFFQGVLDEARIWNVARSQADIQSTMNQEITTVPTGLLGRWGMNEGSGLTVYNTVAGAVNGTAIGGPTWVPDIIPPLAPQGVSSTAGNGLVTLRWAANSETDLAGYNIYRSTTSPVPTTGTALNGTNPQLTTNFTDHAAGNGTTYYYVVTALDTSHNQSSASVETSATPQLSAGSALQFNGSSQYVTFGPAPALGTRSFTLETWFIRLATGVPTSTGTGGVTAVPLVTKGRAQDEGSNVDMNYFLGIDGATGVLVADFEEFTGPGPAGQNHPISGVTVIPVGNSWHHAAATYDVTTGVWNLYLDGTLERTATLTGSPVPRWDSIQHAGLATAMNSTGVVAGFFQGVLDEARIWNYARTQTQIQAGKNIEIASLPGLIGRWGLNDASGASVADSSASGVNGTAVGTPEWVGGFPIVPPVNHAPVVDAGADQTITLPSAANLNGTVTDDGLPIPPGEVNVTWSMLSGPAAISFTNPNALSTTATFSLSGTYVIDLAAFDGVSTSDDQATITVNPPLNLPPVVSAGADQTITLPAGASLNGTVTDDGLPNPPHAVSTTWTVIGGTGTVTFANPNAATTTATFSLAGTYVLNLAAYDGQFTTNGQVTITVNPLVVVNQAPVVDAGPDQTITLPSSVNLNGAVSDDGLPSGSLTISWSVVSGPGTVTFADPNAATMTATFSAAGVYVLRLTANDSALYTSDDITVTVNPEPGNYALDFNGTSGYVALGNPAKLGLSEFTIETWFMSTGAGVTASTGSGGVTAVPLVTKGRHESDRSNVDMNYFLGIDASSKLAADFEDMASGANHPIIGSTVITNNIWHHAAATYDGTTWRLYLDGVLDGTLAVNQIPRSDSIQHAAIGTTFDSSANESPEGFFGGVIDEARIWDHALTATEIQTNLNSEISTATGLVARWGLNEGIGTTAGDSTTTPVNGTINGAFTWVAGAPFNMNLAPVVNAGPDQTITLPATANLNGTVSDDGLPVGGTLTTSWSVVSGAGTVTFANPSAAITTATFSASGSYVLRLTANDGALSTSDDVTITVNVNLAPVVSAGPDQTITLPADASLSGTVSDDGLPTPGAVTITWSVVSGSGTVTFVNPNSVVTNATFSVAGVYVLRLTANDGALSTSDDVSVTVNPVIVVNQAPVVNAGLDQTITLPSGANLNGTVSDDGLPAGSLTISWSVVSGPGTVTFADPNAAHTTATFSIAGLYVLRLTASDGLLSGSDDVTVTVYPVLGNYALEFDGTSGYVGFGNPAKLHLPTFTIEAWFKREGAGNPTTTGTNGITSAIPLVTRGRGEREDPAVDMNYFLGIDNTNNVVAADFEEGASGPNPSLNHPVFGITPITNNVWHHAAATYDGNKWQLFLDGVLETEVVVGRPAAAAGNQYAAIGSALNSTGGADGFFAGVIDEARVWDHALTAAEIRTNLNLEINNAAGLVARWGLNEDIGTTAGDSTLNPVNGTVSGGFTWVAGAPFNINAAPVVNAGPDQTITLPAAASLNGTASDDGLPSPPSAFTVSWTVVSGPGTVTFGNPALATTTATFSAPGVYLLRLTANDGALSTSDDVSVTANPVIVVNQAPVVNAGPDQTITLPSGANLSGTVSDDGLPAGNLTISWTLISGPGTVSFADPSAATTTATFSAAGSYVLRLTGNDTALTASDDVTVTVTPEPGNSALLFGGADAYVSILDSTKLHLSTFTVEAWFRRDGAGVGTNTGNSGIASAVPLVTKGRAESETATTDINYFLGIDTNGNVLAADFEEAQTGGAPSLNHPVRGVTPITTGVWHHAAATYDGNKWQLFMDGVLETELVVGQPPAFASTQRVAIGSALDSNQVASGFFNGVIDEVRIWDHARTQAEIQASIDQQLASGIGLVARWGLNEGIGTTTADSLVSPANGTILGTSYSWVSGAPFNLNSPPVVDAGPDQTITLPGTASLNGTATDDGLPDPPHALTTTWSQVSGPGAVTFGDTHTLVTTATFSAGGSYVLRLTASDGTFSASDDMAVTVVGNQYPVVSAGPDLTITLPGNANLIGSASDDGLPAPPTLTIQWSQVSGPGTVTFAGPSSPVTTASFSVDGVYVLRLTASDGQLTSSDDVTVTVNPIVIVPNYAIQFGGSSYVTFGDPAKLHLPTFTIETWLNRQGAGTGTSTGSGGLTSAIPLVAKGRAETDTAPTDMNYFLGIDAATGTLAADFEEGQGGTSPSLNHPVYGVTPITSSTWHHAAATYDGTTWRLYLDGVLETQLTVGQPPAAAGTQHASIASALNSTGVAAGNFAGVIDEARIWSRALSQAEIQANINQQLTSGTGLVARWGLNEDAGTTINDSIAAPANGTLTGTGSSWVNGAPFNIVIRTNHAPDQPVLNAPSDGATDVATPATLDVSVSDPDADNLTVTFYGRVKDGTGTPGPDFTIVALPDTQYYSSSLNGGSPAIFNSQTQWIVDNKDPLNIAFVTQLGDCVEHGDNSGNPIEWDVASAAISKIEDPLATLLPDGMPFAVAVGNHDQSPIGDPTGTTTFYNQYFGVGHFAGRGYYGGHYGTDNDNSFQLFSASGMDFIIIHLEYDPSANPAVLSWANNLLQTNSNRRAIVVSHFLINTGNPGTWGAQGQAIYNALKGNSNLFLMLAGHVPGEGRRQDTFSGNTVNTVLSDYQSLPNGGNGWLRVMRFSPAGNTIHVQTYSPWLNQYNTAASSQFDLSYTMAGSNSFSVIGTASVASGAHATTTWTGLAPNTQYEWYATVSDGLTAITGPTWTFGTVLVSNSPPVANDQSLTLNEDTPQAITLTASDLNGDPLTFTLVTSPANGTLSGTAPNLTYTPTLNYNGPDSFTFKANDGKVDSNIATVSITVTAVNDPPVANAQAVTTDEDSAVSVTLTGSDADGDVLILSIVNNPSHGTLSGTLPNLIYTPAPNYNGSDSFTFKANDGKVDSNVATVSITVTAVNDLPVANAQSVTTNEDTAKAIALSATDVDGDALTYSVVTGPVHGTLSGTAPNLTYTPALNYNGSDSFTFKANDGKVDSNIATVSITVTAVNDPPVASSGSINAKIGVAVAGQLIATDVDSSTLTYSIVTLPKKGTVSVNQTTGAFTYTAKAKGTDSFTFRAYDGAAYSNTAKISVNIR